MSVSVTLEVENHAVDHFCLVSYVCQMSRDIVGSNLHVSRQVLGANGLDFAEAGWSFVGHSTLVELCLAPKWLIVEASLKQADLGTPGHLQHVVAFCVGLDKLLQDAVVRFLSVVEEFEKLGFVHELKVRQIFVSVVVAIVLDEGCVGWVFRPAIVVFREEYSTVNLRFFAFLLLSLFHFFVRLGDFAE